MDLHLIEQSSTNNDKFTLFKHGKLTIMNNNIIFLIYENNEITSRLIDTINNPTAKKFNPTVFVTP